MMQDDSQSLCAFQFNSFWILNYIPAELWIISKRHIVRASWHVGVLKGRQELHRCCKKVTNSLKTADGFGKLMAICISDTAKIHPKEWMRLWEMCKPLAITFFSRHKNGVPLCDSDNTGGWSAGPPECCCCWAQLHNTLQFGLLSKRSGVGVLTHTNSWRPWLSKCPMGCWSSPHKTGREQSFGTGGTRLTATEWLLLVKCSWKVPWKKKQTKRLNRGRKLSPWSCSATFYCCRRCWQPPSLEDLSKVIELNVYLGRGPKTQGSCSDLAPQCAFRWPKGSLDPSASTMATDTFSHWPLYLVPAAWKYFKMATPQKSSPAAVDFEHEGQKRAEHVEGRQYSGRVKQEYC